MRVRRHGAFEQTWGTTAAITGERCTRKRKCALSELCEFDYWAAGLLNAARRRDECVVAHSATGGALEL